MALVYTTHQKVQFSLEYLLKALDGTFPRHIMTQKTRGQVLVSSLEEAMDYFEKSNWTDCRIAVFGLEEIESVTPKTIFIDLDDKTQLEYVKSRMNRILHTTPLVISTGSGLALVQPVQMQSLKGLKFEGMNGEEISKKFLLFCKDYLTNETADPANHPTLKSCLLRVPHTVNSKNGNIVRIIETWNGIRVPVKDLPFKKYLEEETQKEKQFQNNLIIINPENYSWIENILENKVSDGRERLLSFCISRYLVNVKKLTISQSMEIVSRWSDMSKETIKHRLLKAKKQNKLPVSLETFLEKNSDLKQILDTIPNLTKLNKNTKSIQPIKIENYDELSGKFIPNTPIEEIGYSKTPDPDHQLLLCYDCNPRGAGDFAPNSKVYQFHMKHCKNIRFISQEEADVEKHQAKYSRPMTEREIKLLEELA